MTRPRAAIVGTGSELVRGTLADGNGPFLAAEAVRVGLEPARIVLVGDRPDELEAVIRDALEADLCVVSGGLGPTHDDRTVEVVARLAGRRLVVDAELEAEIEAVSRRIAERLDRPYADFAAGVRKQASLPEDAHVVGLAGTAPGLVLEVCDTVVVVLPGPPGELRRLWPRALETSPVRGLLAQARPRGHTALRFFGVSESAVARAFEDAGGEGDGVEATICARDMEIHVELLADDPDRRRADEVAAALRAQLGRFLFAEDARPVAEIVLALCRSQGLTLATAESCTGGLVGARLTSVPGSSDAYVGGVVAYSDEIKRTHLGVADELLARHGAVSAEVAASMAAGARTRLGASVAVAVTGVAGPGGGTERKPIGLVHLHAIAPQGPSSRELRLPGDRESVRALATAASLHLVRELLSRSRHSSE